MNYIVDRRWFCDLQRLLVLLCAIALVLGSSGCGGEIASEANPPPEIAAPQEAMVLPAAVEAAVLQAAGELTQVVRSQLTISEATPQDWPDGCLGLATADEFCTAVLVPGWSVTVSDGQQQWDFRTDAQGEQIRLDAS